MKDYSPKRRTAVVFAGCGTAGAYHAGVLKALDESGARVDLVVGSGVGTLAAAFGAVAGGQRLYGKGGFWRGLGWQRLYRLRPALRAGLLLGGFAFGVFLLPLVLATLAGLLFPVVLVVDLIAPGVPYEWLGRAWAAPAALRIPYLAALAAPSFLLSVLAFVWGARLLVRERRRAPEAFEYLFDAGPARRRLAEGLWEVARGAAVSKAPPSETELGRKYVGLAGENLGEPGFRELILRASDLETGEAIAFVLLRDEARAGFARALGRGPRSSLDAPQGVLDLRGGYESLFFEAAATGLLPPFLGAQPRVAFPRGGLHSGETHRLADATLAGGCGVAEALAAGAEQVVLVTAVPEAGPLSSRRRGPGALADSVLALLERRTVEQELRAAERINRMVETLGHESPGGGRAWEDPASGRTFRSFALHVIRPARRGLGPLELDGARDPATEVVESLEDLMQRGYRDAYRSFLEPVVGAAPEAARPAPVEREEGRLVEL